MRDLNERERAALQAAQELSEKIIAQIRGMIIMLLVPALKLFCVAAAVFGAAWAFEPVWLSFGGDVAGLVPASAIVVTPSAAALAFGAGWGGLLFVGALTFGLGEALPRLDIVTHGLLTVVPVGVAVIHTLTREVQHEQE